MSESTTFEPADDFPIDDLETLQVVIGEPRIEIIELLRQPMSVAELAERMGVPRTRLYHHIKMLEDVGAIVVVDERRAGAMNEKIYSVAAKTFQPSEKFLQRATPREQAVAMVDSLFSVTRTDLVRAVERNQLAFDDPGSKRRMALARHVLTLTPERRAELIDRFESLVSEYADDAESDETEPFGVLLIAHPSSRSTN